MIVASRTLRLANNGQDILIPIRIHAPEAAARDWICRFEIEWPEGKVERWGVGFDSVQAFLIAMQMIGAEIYASRHHESGRLVWFEPQNGYGFPVTRNMRDLLVGDDLRFL